MVAARGPSPRLRRFWEPLGPRKANHRDAEAQRDILGCTFKRASVARATSKLLAAHANDVCLLLTKPPLFSVSSVPLW